MADEKTCFIIMPITTPAEFLSNYRDGADHFKHVLECLLVPGVEGGGYRAISPKATGADLIHAEIIRNLEQADLVLCDMSCLNPNVFFELGIRTSLNKPVCVIKDELTKRIPFDTGILNHHQYKSTLDSWELADEIRKLVEHIKTSEERSKGQNMLWKYFGLRTEASAYAGETGPEAKLDYLAMQIDSLRQQVGSLTQSSGRYGSSTHCIDIPAVRDSIIGRLPKGVEFVGFSYTPRFSIGSRQRVVLHYAGAFASCDRRALHDYAAAEYDIDLRVRPVSDAQPDDSQKGLGPCQSNVVP